MTSAKRMGIVETGLTRIQEHLAKVQRDTQMQGAMDQAMRDELGIIRKELQQLLDGHLKRGLLPKFGPPESSMIPNIEEAIALIGTSIESGSITYLTGAISRLQVAIDIIKSM